MAKELKIRFVGDSSGLKKAADDSEGILSGFGKKISAFSVASGTLIADGLKAGFSAVGGLIGDAIGGASDLNESMSKVGQLFGESSAAVVAFAESAAVGLGQSKQQALDAASTFATFGKAAGLAGDDLLRFSTSNTTMASDFASFFNTSPEEAIEKIGAAFRGEAEPIRSFGILLDADSVKAKAVSLGLVQASVDTLKLSKAQETAEKAGRTYAAQLQKFGEGSVQAGDAARDLEQAQMALSSVVEGSIPDLTTQQKVLATQQIIMDQGAAAMGDFAKTSDGLANKQRILSAQFTNLKTNIGQAFLPIVLDLATAFQTKIMPLLEEFGPLIGQKVAVAVTTLRAEFVEILPRLLELGQAFKDRIAGAVGWFIDNMDTIKMVLTDIVPPVAAAVGAYMGFVKLQAAATAVRAFGVAFKAMSVALLANPVGLVVAGVAALGVGLWVAYRRSEQFRDAVNALASQVRQWWDGLVATFRADGLGAAMSYAWEGVKSAFGQFFGWMESTALPWLGEKVGMLAGVLGGWIGQAAQYLVDNLPGWLGAFADWFTGTADPWVREKMLELAVQMGEWIKQGAAYLRENLPIWLGDFAEWFAGTALPWLVDKGVEMADKLADWVEDSAVKLLRNLPGWIVKFERWVRTDALPAMAQFGLDAALAIKDALLGALDFMNDIASQIVSGLISGLWSQAGRLASEVQAFIASTIPGPVQSLLGIGGGGGDLASMTSQRATGSFTTQSLAVASSGASNWQAANITVQSIIDGRQVALATAPYSRQLARTRA